MYHAAPDHISQKYKQMRTYITGFMGSGKSTVGRLLAEQQSCSFIDTDTWIEEHIGMSIPAYFASEGEAAFRQRETDALEATATHDHAVVATGGGMLVNPTNMQRAKTLGTVVYLRVDVDVLHTRLAPDAAARPLLCDATGTPRTGDDLHARISDLLNTRAPFYEAAHVTVDANASPPTVATRIANTLLHR